jgi:hypothetical protein
MAVNIQKKNENKYKNIKKDPCRDPQPNTNPPPKKKKKKRLKLLKKTLHFFFFLSLSFFF